MAYHNRLMDEELAGQAENGAAQELERQDPVGLPEDPREIRADRDIVREAAAKLYGQGYRRPQIARILRKHLITANMKTRPMDQQLSTARAKLRGWERDQKFRDMVYKDAIVKLDLEMPMIFKGVAAKAKRGRVDAARLALEVTGRHNPKGDQAPTQIALIVNGVPRPQVRSAMNSPQVMVDGSTNEAIIDEELKEG